MSRLYCIALVAFASLLSWVEAAAAADPTNIGKNLENVVTPNVKSFWKIGLLIGVVVIVFGRVKSSVVVAFFVCIAVSGIVIYNPAGFTDLIKSIGNQVL